MTTKQKLKALINKFSYGDYRNGNLPAWCLEFDEYPDLLVQVLMDSFDLTPKKLSVRNGFIEKQETKPLNYRLNAPCLCGRIHSLQVQKTGVAKTDRLLRKMAERELIEASKACREKNHKFKVIKNFKSNLK
jgi:hypothetical protein